MIPIDVLVHELLKEGDIFSYSNDNRQSIYLVKIGNNSRTYMKEKYQVCCNRDRSVLYIIVLVLIGLWIVLIWVVFQRGKIY